MCEFLTDKKALNLISKVEEPFKQLPHLPKGFVELLVKIVPWGVALGGIFSLTGAISSLRYGFGMSPVGQVMKHYLGVTPIYFILSAVLMLAMAYLAFKAFSPLKEKKMLGWIYIFWSNVVSIVHSLLGLIFLTSSGVSFIFGTIIGFYLLFELKPAYEPKKKETVKKKPSKKKS